MIGCIYSEKIFSFSERLAIVTVDSVSPPGLFNTDNN
jgi:hypothetical protein